MKKFRFIMITLFTTLVVAACSDTSTAPPPTLEGNLVAPDITIVYSNVNTYQQSYIRSLQLSSGAIKDDEQENGKITPYFANFAAMALLTNPSTENQKVVQKYIKWYAKKLNRSKNPVTGTSEIEGSIYDYYGKDETTKGTYDSVDSYAATFLELVKQYAQISSENTEWLKEYTEKISMVAKALVKMIDTEKTAVPTTISPDENDFLSVASYVYPAKYLMDNCEVNMGLKAAQWLKENGLLESKEDFAVLLKGNTNGIESLFNGEEYNWEKSNATDWNRFYADAVSQLYPGIFGVEVADAQRNERLYDKFNSKYRGWETGVTFEAFPWAVISYAAAMNNDVERVKSYMTHINSLNIKGQQKKRWYSAEAAFVVLAINKVNNSAAKSE